MKNNKAKKKAAKKVEPKVVTKCDNLNEVTQNHDELITPVAQSSPESVRVKSMIRVITGQQVMFDSDFTLLYGIKIRRLNELLKRYVERFLNDFLFHLSKEFFLKSQFAISNIYNIAKKTIIYEQ